MDRWPTQGGFAEGEASGNFVGGMGVVSEIPLRHSLMPSLLGKVSPRVQSLPRERIRSVVLEVTVFLAIPYGIMYLLKPLLPLQDAFLS